MTTAPAPLHPPRPAPGPSARTAPLRVARPIDALDLDAALADALAPHAPRPAASPALAPVVDLDAHRRRSATWARRRRRRLLLVVLGIGLAAALAAGLASRGPAAQDTPAPATGATVMIEPGQTLWDVAAGVTPAGGDVRATVAQIRQLNGLDTGAVPAWTTVVLPAQ